MFHGLKGCEATRKTDFVTCNHFNFVRINPSAMAVTM